MFVKIVEITPDEHKFVQETLYQCDSIQRESEKTHKDLNVVFTLWQAVNEKYNKMRCIAEVSRTANRKKVYIMNDKGDTIETSISEPQINK